jgi:hypothetical protein
MNQLELTPCLIRGELDFIIGMAHFYGDAEGLRQRVLFRDRLSVIARLSHPAFDPSSPPSVPCVDGPLDAREKVRNLTGGSIAIMCPAFLTRHHVRCPPTAFHRLRRRNLCCLRPDGVRDPLPSNDTASKAAVQNGFFGSSVRPIVISFKLFHPGINARFRRTPADTDKPPCASSWPMPSGHLVVQSRPKPRGGSIA